MAGVSGVDLDCSWALKRIGWLIIGGQEGDL